MELKVYSGTPTDAMKIRKKVFVDEQGFVDELDELDKTAICLVLYSERNTPVATCRAYRIENTDNFVLGRLAVVKEFRGQFLGTKLVKEMENQVRSLGGKRILIHSQYHARGFYGTLGYTENGEPEEEQGHLHVWMKKELN